MFMNKVLVLLCAVFFLTNNNLINAQILTSSKHPIIIINTDDEDIPCLLYTSPSPRDKRQSRMPSSA